MHSGCHCVPRGRRKTGTTLRPGQSADRRRTAAADGAVRLPAHYCVPRRRTKRFKCWRPPGAHPADFWLDHRLAYMLDNYTNRREEAVGYYRAALAIRPDSPGVYVNLSVALTHLGRYDEAEEAVRKAIQLKNDFAEAYVNLAYFLGRRQQFDEAEAAMRQRARPGEG